MRKRMLSTALAVWVLMLATFEQSPALARGMTLAELEQKATEDPKAARELGLRFIQGKGVIKDTKKGVMWLERAAKQGDEVSAGLLCRSFKNPKSEHYDREKARDFCSAELSERPNDNPRNNQTQPRWPSENLPRANPTGVGSGFAINREGVFVTNFHVVAKCSSTVVEYQGMRGRAKLIAFSQEDDLALLEVAGHTHNFLPLRSTGARLGEETRIAGFPDGVIKISQGIVGRTGDEIIQVSASISSGNSGGPVIDKSGHVIGVAVAKAPAGLDDGSVRGDDYNFAVSVNRLKSFLNEKRVVHTTSSSPRDIPSEYSAQLLARASAMILCYR